MDNTELTNDYKQGIAQIARKMALVMSKIGRLEKRGQITDSPQRYKYATNDDVVDVVREAMAAANLALLLTVNNYQQEEITSSKGTRGYYTTVDLNFTLICGDTGETVSSRYIGHSTDYGDKGFNKAVTSAEKYWLMKTFLISAGDDPDAELPENGTRPQQSAKPANKPETPPMAWYEDPNAVATLITAFINWGYVQQGATQADVEKLLGKPFSQFESGKHVAKAMQTLHEEREKQQPTTPAQQQPMKQTRSGTVSRATYNGKVIGLDVDEYEDSVPMWSRSELYDLIAQHSKEYADALDVKNWSGTKDAPLTCYPCLYITYTVDDKGGKKLTTLTLTDDYHAALLDPNDIPF